jgi:hypothetical protein
VRPALRLRQVVNLVNLTTPVGLLVGLAGRARFERGPDGLVLGRGWRMPFRTAPAFTVGNVVLLRLDDAALARRPRLIDHESRHATQYAWCLGPVMWPLYLVAAGVSLVLCGHPGRRNVFEVLAGLADGGYVRPEGA